MTSTETRFAVMFADVAGSTRLYESLGDKDAKALVDDIIARMTAVTGEQGGVVIKTIGDEIMARFPSAESGIRAACLIQEAIDLLPPVRGAKLAVRIGLHWGPVILQADDVFGDAVNVAARMAGIAKGRQVITTAETVTDLPSDLREKTRMVDRTMVKGRQGEILVHEVLWEARQDVTAIFKLQSGMLAALAQASLSLRCDGNEMTLRAEEGPFLLGRGDDCQLVVLGTLTSRQHARIEFRRGKFVLIDQSTNGTWVRSDDGKDHYLRREELPLWGDGLISLGDRIHPEHPSTIQFSTRY